MTSRAQGPIPLSASFSFSALELEKVALHKVAQVLSLASTKASFRAEVEAYLFLVLEQASSPRLA